MAELKMIGNFNHVTATGVVSFWNLMDSWGTIGLLHDMTNQQKLDAIMCKTDFDMTRYICEKFDTAESTDVFDEGMINLHDELCDAIFALQFCFASGLDLIYNASGRGFAGLKSIPEVLVWEQQTCYPIIKNKFTTTRDLSDYCAEHCTENNTVIVTVRASGKDGINPAPQEFEWHIVGAEEYNTLETLCDIMVTGGYDTWEFITR